MYYHCKRNTDNSVLKAFNNLSNEAKKQYLHKIEFRNSQLGRMILSQYYKS